MAYIVYYLILAAVLFMGACAAYDYKMNYISNPFEK